MDTWVVADKTRMKDRFQNRLQVRSADPYQLYCKIIEVSQIDGRKDKNAKFIVKFWLETVEGVKVSGSSGKTRTHTKSLQPIWNEEWIIPRISGDQHKFRLHFVLYECFTLRSDTPIGECIYDVDQNTTLGVREIVLDLLTPNRSKSSAKGKSTEMAASPRVCGKIKILCHKQPLFESSEERDKRRNEVEKRSVHLPSLRMVLEKASYYPGELVRGLVICNITRPMNKPSLELKFFGETTVWWRDIDNNEYASRMRHVSYTMDSIGDDAQGENGDRLCYPFSFPLPDYIPPSFDGKDGSTKYHLSTSLDGSKNPEKSHTVDIEVLARYDTSIPSALALGQSCSADSPDKAIKQSVTCPYRIEAGSKLPIKFSINNPAGSMRTIHSVTASVIQDFFYYGADAQTWNMVSNAVVTKISSVSLVKGNAPSKKSDNGELQSILPISPGQQVQFTVFLEVPASTPPTVLEQINPLINVQYSVEGICLSEGAARNQVQIPLIVSSRPNSPPHSQNPPSAKMRGLNARVIGERTVRTDGEDLENTTSSLQSKAPLDLFSPKKADATLCESDPSPGDTDSQPSSSTDQTPIPSSPSAQESLALNDASTSAMPPSTNATEDQARRNVIVLFTQPFNPISSKNSSVTTLNDAPTTHYINPKLLTVQKSTFGRSFRATNPFEIFEERKRIQKVVLRDDPTSETYLQAALQKAIAENGKTNSEPPTVGNEKSDSNMLPPATENDLIMTIYCSSEIVPSFADFFPPGPLCPGSNDIPISASNLPDYASLGISKISSASLG